MTKTILARTLAAAAFALPASAAMAAMPMTPPMGTMPTMYEEQVAHREEALIIDAPIAGVRNSKWFDYRINVTEAKKELASDMKRATDIEDKRDAWGEYAHELKHERHEYVSAMKKKGYRVPTIYFED